MAAMFGIGGGGGGGGIHGALIVDDDSFSESILLLIDCVFFFSNSKLSIDELKLIRTSNIFWWHKDVGTQFLLIANFEQSLNFYLILKRSMFSKFTFTRFGLCLPKKKK